MNANQSKSPKWASSDVSLLISCAICAITSHIVFKKTMEINYKQPIMAFNYAAVDLLKFARVNGLKASRSPSTLAAPWHPLMLHSSTDEVNALTEQIEADKKSTETVAMKEDLSESEKDLIDDEKPLPSKAGEWEVLCKSRSEELVVSADTIKIIEDDCALESLKKTLTGASSFIQLEVTPASTRRQLLHRPNCVTIKSQVARA